MVPGGAWPAPTPRPLSITRPPSEDTSPGNNGCGSASLPRPDSEVHVDDSFALNLPAAVSAASGLPRSGKGQHQLAADPDAPHESPSGHATHPHAGSEVDQPNARTWGGPPRYPTPGVDWPADGSSPEPRPPPHPPAETYPPWYALPNGHQWPTTVRFGGWPQPAPPQQLPPGMVSDATQLPSAWTHSAPQHLYAWPHASPHVHHVPPMVPPWMARPPHPAMMTHPGDTRPPLRPTPNREPYPMLGHIPQAAFPPWVSYPHMDSVRPSFSPEASEDAEMQSPDEVASRGWTPEEMAEFNAMGPFRCGYRPPGTDADRDSIFAGAASASEMGQDHSVPVGSCRHTCTTIQELERHRTDVHGIAPPLAEACPVCLREMSCRSHVKRHLKACHGCSERWPCHICGRNFSSASNRKAHVNSVHLRTRPYSCPFCQHSFNRRTHLRSHCRRLHGRDLPLKDDDDNS
jgi:hypothetical protein